MVVVPDGDVKVIRKSPGDEWVISTLRATYAQFIQKNSFFGERKIEVKDSPNQLWSQNLLASGSEFQ